jgi:hypothetical protein
MHHSALIQRCSFGITLSVGINPLTQLGTYFESGFSCWFYANDQPSNLSLPHPLHPLCVDGPVAGE